MTARRRTILLSLTAALVVPLSPLLAQPEDDTRESYSYVRTLEGRATLASFGNGPGEEADLNQILQRGDRLRIERGARIEVALADRNLLRVGGGSDLTLVQIAFSADGDDRATRIDLDRGELVLDVTDEALGDELPEIRTLSARIFVNEPGTYRVRAESDGYTELVVRAGFAELLTDRGSTIVRAGEEAWTSGDRWRPVELVAAGARDALERWSDELVATAELAQERLPYVEPELAYAAAPLADYGNWVSVGASWYWQPRVAAGWRPYYDGRWAWSPSGLTWVSAEPWGWVPYHYGTWCDLPGYGWAWRPGRVYSPAWVYWYWSDSWTGWCPMGYYTDFYRGYWNSGFRFGVYGWTGGSWGSYSHWNFGPTGRVCDRRRRGGWHHGDQVARSGGPSEPNGLLTTDTSGLPRDRWDRPAELVRVLERGPRDGRPRELPVVTDFVARKVELPPSVDGAIRPEPTARSNRRTGTPLDPGGVSGGGREREIARVAPDREPGWRSRKPQDTGQASPQPADRGHDGGDAESHARRPETQPVARNRSDAVPRSTRGPETPNRDADVNSGRSRGSDLSNERSAAPTDRQGWKQTGGGAPDPGRELGASGGSRQPPSDRPGADPRGQINGGQRGRPAVEPGAPIRVPIGTVPEENRGSPRSRESGSSQSGGERRYGYPAREITGSGSVTRTPPPSAERPPGTVQRFDGPPVVPTEPVERVIGGVRRAAPTTGTNQPQGSGYGAPTPPPGYRAPSTPSVRTAPGSTRSTPPASGGSYAPPSRQAPTGQRATPPPGRSSGGTSVGRPATQSGGQKASPPPSSSSSSSSGSSSSPPPRRGSKPGGGRD